MIRALTLLMSFCLAAGPVAGQTGSAEPRVSYGLGSGGGSVAFSPDGRYLAAGGTLWDVRTGHPVRKVAGTLFSPDGKHLIDIGEGDPGEGSVVRLYDAVSGAPVLDFKTGRRISSKAFSPDGRYIATGGITDSLVLWDARTGKKVRSFDFGHKHPNPYLYYVFAVDFSPSGKILAAGGTDRTIDLWDPETGEKIRSLEKRESNVFELAFSPDGRFLAAADGDGRTAVWDARTWKLLGEYKGHAGRVLSLAFSSDGRHLLSSGGIPEEISPEEPDEPFETFVGAVKIREVSTGRELKTFRNMGAAAYSPDGKLIAGVGDDGTVRILDAETGRQLSAITEKRDKISSVDVSADGKTLIVTGDKGSYVLGLDPVFKLRRLPPNDVGGQNYDSIALTPDGKSIVRFFSPEYGSKKGGDKTDEKKDGGREGVEKSKMPDDDGYREGRLVFYDADSLSETRTVGLGSEILSVKHFSFIRNGTVLVLSDRGGSKVVLVDMKSGRVLRKFEPFGVSGNYNPVTPAPVFTPDHSQMITWGDGGDIKVWSVDSGRLLKTVRNVVPGFASALAVAPDGRTLAAADVSGNGIHLVDLVSGVKPADPVLNETERVCSVAFSPDGQRLAAVTGFSLRVWERATGKEIKEPKIETWMSGSCEMVWTDHDVGLVRMAGKMIRLEYDREIRLKDPATGKLLAELTILNDEDWVVITPDGRFEGSDGGLREIFLTDGEKVFEIEAKKHENYRPGLMSDILKGRN